MYVHVFCDDMMPWCFMAPRIYHMFRYFSHNFTYVFRKLIKIMMLILFPCLVIPFNVDFVFVNSAAKGKTLQKFLHICDALHMKLNFNVSTYMLMLF